MRRVTGEGPQKRKVLYKISEWRRECLLEMVGLDPLDARSQYEFHRRQGFDLQDPPLCVRRDTCMQQYHFFVDCPNVHYGDDFANMWIHWTEVEERSLQKQWDNHAKQSGKSTGTAGSAYFYPTRSSSIDVTESDGPLHEPMNSENERQRSVHFDNEVVFEANLVKPSAHAISARIVARVRKRPYSSTHIEASSTKKLKTFVTDNKGKVIATGFHNEKRVHKDNTDASQPSSKQQIYGDNASCIVGTSSDINLLGRKHLKEFEKSGIS